MRILKILVPVDGSGPSLAAVRYGAGIAKLTGAQMLLLHCHKPVPSFLGEPNFQMVLDRLEAESQRILERCLAVLPDEGLEVSSRVIGGDTAVVIMEVASIEGFDLIVMGSRGLGGVQGLLLGSVTHKVLQIAPCPVTVVR